MNNLKEKLPTQDSSVGRGIKAGAYATISALIIFSSGFLNTLNGVPGCSEAVLAYIQANAIQLALFIGVPAGAISYGFNLFRPGVKNW